jgi:hypothetical protein
LRIRSVEKLGVPIRICAAAHLGRGTECNDRPPVRLVRPGSCHAHARARLPMVMAVWVGRTVGGAIRTIDAALSGTRPRGNVAAEKRRHGRGPLVFVAGTGTTGVQGRLGGGAPGERSCERRVLMLRCWRASRDFGGEGQFVYDPRDRRLPIASDRRPLMRRHPGHRQRGWYCIRFRFHSPRRRRGILVSQLKRAARDWWEWHGLCCCRCSCGCCCGWAGGCRGGDPCRSFARRGRARRENSRRRLFSDRLYLRHRLSCWAGNCMGCEAFCCSGFGGRRSHCVEGDRTMWCGIPVGDAMSQAKP